MEDYGLTEEEQFTYQTDDITLRSALREMLSTRDLTYHFSNESLLITSDDAVEKNLRIRLYFTEGTGVVENNFSFLIDLLQTMTKPEAWENYGGRSKMTPAFQIGNDNRPAIVVSAPTDVHYLLEKAMKGIRGPVLETP